MNKSQITLVAIFTFVAASLIVANPTFPPCITDTDVNPAGCKSLKCCLTACNELCPGGPPGSGPVNNPEHTKCYEGCDALFN
jgi:hypothetical protein